MFSIASSNSFIDGPISYRLVLERIPFYKQDDPRRLPVRPSRFQYHLQTRATSLLRTAVFAQVLHNWLKLSTGKSLIITTAWEFQAFALFYLPSHSSVSRSSKFIEYIMTMRPAMTMAFMKKEAQTRPAATDPTSVSQPLSKACLTTEPLDVAATCCQVAAVSENKVDKVMHAAQMAEIFREGSGLTSTMLPVSRSVSSCQPGNVARPAIVTLVSTALKILSWSAFRPVSMLPMDVLLTKVPEKALHSGSDAADQQDLSHWTLEWICVELHRHKPIADRWICCTHRSSPLALLCFVEYLTPSDWSQFYRP